MPCTKGQEKRGSEGEWQVTRVDEQRRGDCFVGGPVILSTAKDLSGFWTILLVTQCENL